MALSRVQYQQSAPGNKNFAVPFQYISKDDVKVSVDGVEAAFTWLNPTTVQISEAPSVGAIIDINRETNRDKLLVDFTDGSTITENQLDLASRQSFYLAQEAFDTVTSNLSVTADGSYSAGGRKISLLADPESDTDAATQGYVKHVLTVDVAAYVAAAAASAAASAASADEAEVFADEAETHKNGAEAAKAATETLLTAVLNFLAAPYNRDDYVATEGQDTFAATYTAPYVKVYVNGLLLPMSDYTATDGTSVVLNSGVPAGTEVTVEGW